MSVQALVVEDSTTWQNIFQNLLSDTGYSVYQAQTYQDALALINQHDFALAILDISLDRNDQNNRDGLKLMQMIKHSMPKIQIIIASGTVKFQERELDTLEKKVAKVFEKSQFDRQHFLNLLHELHGKIPHLHQSEQHIISSNPIIHQYTQYIGKALVVENNERWQRIIKDALLAEKLDVVVVRDAPAAMGELIREQYHLVTIDLNLDSSHSEGNRDGRHLLQQADAHSIPAIVISGYLQTNEVIADYEQYQVLRILDKAGFNREHFCSLVREAIFRQLPVVPIEIDGDLMYKVVQTLLRNRLQQNRILAKKAPLQTLSQILERPLLTFLPQLRETFEQTFTDILNEAEKEEFREQSIDQRAYPEPGDFTRAFIQKMKADQQQHPIYIQSERMQRMLVLQTLYSHGYSLRPLLLKQLAVADGALNRLRKKGIVELAARLRRRWPS